MRYLITAAFTAGALLGAIPASAQQAQTLHYSGGFSCGKDDYATDWNVRKHVSGEVTIKVYYQQHGQGRVNWLDLTERKASDGMHLEDANGNPRLKVAPDGDMIRATWMKGQPQSDCSIFSVSRSESPRARFDRLFTLLVAAEPTEELADSVEQATRLAPIIYALPELDQDSYSQRYRQASADFWIRYRKTLATQLVALPISTEAERQALAARVNAALSDTLHVSASGDGFSEILKTLQDTADRLADHGIDPAATLATGNAGLICQRFANLNVASISFEFDKLQLAVAVPFDYWTRDIAEKFLEDAPDCSAIAKDYTQRLVSQWGKIQNRQQFLEKLRTEQARLRALPATIATLVETSNLQPDPEQVRLGYGQSDLAERFFGKPLDARRREILAVAMTDITDGAASYTLDKPDTAEQVSGICDKLAYLNNIEQDSKTEMRETCDAAQATIAKKQTVAAMEKVTMAFASVQPGSDQATAARAVCDTLPRTLYTSAMIVVSRACEEETQKLAKLEDDLRCSSALSATGAPADLLESSIAVAGESGMSKAPLKDLVCGLLIREIDISFSSSGMLMWKSQAMTLRFPASNETLQFVLKEDDKIGADWALAVEDEDTIRQLEKDGMSIEIVSACLMGRSVCRR
ncbi:hypothetical protein PZ897_14310 [Hoeflea sp. YIM 152468]|uniref:hypothetical protein n=1 Tax=Hoeflea sp. YIM 152468 TaxID=3031759 RepID=UPI0023D98817|nr:hypothetical protein [Hoeflea sp. YIM 152468]MDF1609356.1 hypothetical protein [Hoeflea sp. YIM 152468]